jgi:hypothetical protein
MLKKVYCDNALRLIPLARERYDAYVSERSAADQGRE